MRLGFGNRRAYSTRLWIGVLVILALLVIAGCGGKGSGTGGTGGQSGGPAPSGGGTAPSGGGDSGTKGGRQIETGGNCPPGVIYAHPDQHIFGYTIDVVNTGNGLTHTCFMDVMAAEQSLDQAMDFFKQQLPAAGLALQSDAAAKDLTFTGGGASINVLGDDEGFTSVTYRSTATYPDGAALAAAVSSTTHLTPGASGERECLPDGSLIPNEATNVEIGQFLIACHVVFEINGGHHAAIAFFQQALLRPPYELDRYSIQFFIDNDTDAFIMYGAEFLLNAPSLGMEDMTVMLEDDVNADGRSGTVQVSIVWNIARD